MIPNLLKKYPVPEKIPSELKYKINEYLLGNDRKKFLEDSFNYVANKWQGNRLNFFRFDKLFVTDLDEIINIKGYLPCTTMNYVLRIMAVESGLFKDDDIDLILTNTWHLAPHQYLRVRLSEKETIDLDPWNHQHGVPFGKHGSGFGLITMGS